jgi:hypothetical protein
MSGEPILKISDLQPGDEGYVIIQPGPPEHNIRLDRNVYPEINSSMGKCYKISCTEAGLNLTFVTDKVSAEIKQCTLITRAPEFMKSHLSMQQSGWEVVPSSFRLNSHPDGTVFAGAVFQKEAEK